MGNAQRSDERHFLHVSIIDTNLIVAALLVKARENCERRQIIQEGVDSWHRETVTHPGTSFLVTSNAGLA
jgi:hypothetical protein